MLKSLVGTVVAVGTLALSGGAATAESGSQQFLLNSVDDSRRTTVIATGVFDGVGRDVVVDETFQQGPNGTFSFTSEDRFVFGRQGSLFVSIAGQGTSTIDEENCS
ncbi:MAG: hypothetical protein LC708_04325, partial [Actinobacteria bacterium]|nr:hypothetical protein [Actinomycetota bacterium]